MDELKTGTDLWQRGPDDFLFFAHALPAGGPAERSSNLQTKPVPTQTNTKTIRVETKCYKLQLDL